jgi:membrane fusion protein (multidrug efflux system)
MKRILVSVLAAAGLGVLGWYGYQAHRADSKPALEITEKSAKATPPGDGAGGSPSAAAGPGASGASGAAKGAGGPRGPVGVEAAKAEQAALVDEVLAVGTLRARESVVMKPEIAGRIVQIGFTDGAHVTKGALLVALDASVLAAQAEQARAELGLARTSFERTQDLAKRNFVSGSALDQAAANLKVQEAKLQLAEAQLAKTRILAPFSGVLGLRNFSAGDFVKDGAELVTLEDVSSMKVDLRLPERYLGQLRRGQAISVSVDAFPGREFNAQLDALDAQVDANGRSLLARGRLANPDAVLRTGMFAKARIRLKEKPTATVVPEEAIMPIGNEVFVYRIEGGKAMRTKVQTGIRRGGKVEIVEGVQPGDLVVTAGQMRLQRDAMDVRVIDANRRPPAPGATAPAPASAPASASASAPAPAGK